MWVGSLATDVTIAGFAVSGPIAAVVALLCGFGASWLFKKAAEKIVDSDFANALYDWIEKYFDGKGSNSKSFHCYKNYETKYLHM